MSGNKSHAIVGTPYRPTPWEIAHELWYWDDHSDTPDIPLPLEWDLVHKDDPKNDTKVCNPDTFFPPLSKFSYLSTPPRISIC